MRNDGQNAKQSAEKETEQNAKQNTEKLIGKEMLVRLIRSALEARKKAYAPYSHYLVGAALLTEENEIYQGCNIENASYGAANCAERTAIFKAVSEGRRHFTAIAIAGGPEGTDPERYAYPCGICRQVMREFCKEDFLIITALNEEQYRCNTLAQLLPNSFGAKELAADSDTMF